MVGLHSTRTPHTLTHSATPTSTSWGPYECQAQDSTPTSPDRACPSKYTVGQKLMEGPQTECSWSSENGQMQEALLEKEAAELGPGGQKGLRNTEGKA